MRPITQRVNKETQVHAQQQSQLTQLKYLLQRNRLTQQQLYKIHSSISNRLQELSQFIDTHRLKTEHPPVPQMIVILHHSKAKSLRVTSKTIQQQEAIKSTSEKDCDFLNKLSKGNKTKLPIELSNIPFNPSFMISAQSLLSEENNKLGIEIYKQWLQKTQQKQGKRSFTEQEEKLIINKNKIYGDNWQKICQHIQHRSFQQVYYEFHNRINPKLQSGRWSFRLSLMLIILVEHLGLKKWALISSKIAVKSELQVRERHCNILDPSLGRNSWNVRLEQKLLQIAPDYRYCWKQIAKLDIFKDKTDNCIWRKYRNLMIARPQAQIRAMMPNSEKKGLLDKILKFKHNLQQKKHSNKKSMGSRTKNEDYLTLRQNVPIEDVQSQKKQLGQRNASYLISNEF